MDKDTQDFNRIDNLYVYSIFRKAVFTCVLSCLHIPVKVYMMLTQRGSFGGTNLSIVASMDGKPNKTKYLT